DCRAGLGPGLEVGSTEALPSGVSPTFARVHFPPRGRLGGQPGLAGKVELASGKTLPPKAHSSIPAGDRLCILMPGGGGYGDPRKRPAGKGAGGVRGGLGLVGKAGGLYGVALAAGFPGGEKE